MKNILDQLNEARKSFSGQGQYFTFDVNEAYLMLNILQMFKESDKFALLDKDFKASIDGLIEEFAYYVEVRKDEFAARNAEYVDGLNQFAQTGEWQNFKRGRNITKSLSGEEYDFDEMWLTRNAQEAAERLKLWKKYNKNINKVFGKK